MSFFSNNLLHYKQLGGMVALVLCLGSCEQRQAEPVSATPLPQLQAASYYLNAKPSTKEVLEQLDPQTMARMDVLEGDKAATYTHDANTKKVILVQTR